MHHGPLHCDPEPLRDLLKRADQLDDEQLDRLCAWTVRDGAPVREPHELGRVVCALLSGEAERSGGIVLLPAEGWAAPADCGLSDRDRDLLEPAARSVYDQLASRCTHLDAGTLVLTPYAIAASAAAGAGGGPQQPWLAGAWRAACAICRRRLCSGALADVGELHRRSVERRARRVAADDGMLIIDGEMSNLGFVRVTPPWARVWDAEHGWQIFAAAGRRTATVTVTAAGVSVSGA